VEGAIQPHVENILKKVVYKLILDDEPAIAERSQKIAELLGLYVPTDYILPMVLGHLQDQESKAQPLFVQACLKTLSMVVTHSSVRFGTQFSAHIDSLIELIVSSDYLQSENPDILCRTLTLTSNMIHAAGEEFSKPRQHRFFKILLQIGSNP
jgi:hypothetical protein